MTKDEFLTWRNDPVTVRVFTEIADLVEVGKEELSHLAGENSISDARRVGKLDGLRTVLGISFYDLEDEVAQ